MNRRTYLKTGAMALVATSLSAQSSAGAGEGALGKLPAAEFKKINAEAGAKVKALEPGSGKLTDADATLLGEIAMGGMMQLELSKLAVKMSDSKDVKTIAEAEVSEQTALAAKLKEIAKRGDATLPKDPNEKTSSLLKELKGKSGAEFDRSYLKEVGIGGHEMLLKTMQKAISKAGDDAIKKLATTALPLIQTHLQVSTDEAASFA